MSTNDAEVAAANQKTIMPPELKVSKEYVDVNGGYLFKQAENAYKDKDNSAALPLSRAEVALGHTLAKVRQAICHMKGTGVEKNFSTAMDILQPLVDKGCAEAEVTLGSCYRSKSNKLKDPKKARNLETAFAHFSSAANKKNVDGCNFTAECYKKGEGVA